MRSTLYLWAAFIFIGVVGIMYVVITKKHNDRLEKELRYTLAPLPYAYNALEPYIDAQTMKIHYTKHHKKYVDALNAALAQYPELRKKSLAELLTHLELVPEQVRTAVRNYGGGHYNHSFFWLVMTSHADPEPTGKLKELINTHFTSFRQFKEKFSEVAKAVFGSGWAWLSLDKDGALIITTMSDQDCPLSQGFIPLLCLDVWEHAYYLKYQYKRSDYIDAWWHVVNWNQVEKNYQKAYASLRPPK